jgi:feruloyl-CoA synthase
MSGKITEVSFAEPAVDIEKLSGGEIILRSPQIIGDYPKSLSAWIIKWAKKTPDVVFLADRSVEKNSWREITYKEFLIQIKSVAQALLNRGLSLERPVAILSDNSVDNALLLFGAMHVGIPVVPISPAYSLMSNNFGKLKYILGLTSPGLIYIADGNKFSRVLKNIDFNGAEIVVSSNAPVDIKSKDFLELLSVVPTSEVEVNEIKVGPETIAKILFTSGSTGQPKGVINNQRMLCSNQQAVSQVWTFLDKKPPVTVDWLPWNHTFGGNHNLNMILRNGGTMYIDGGKAAPGIIEQTVANLKEISPSVYFNVPRGYDMLIPYFENDPDLREIFFKDLDVIFYAAAALTQSTWKNLERLSKQTTGKRVFMLSGWGATETAPDCTQVYWPISKAGVIGLPIPGTEIKLVPNEEKLEIRVRGPNVMPGYFKDPLLTKEAFDEDGFYLIGDAAKFENPQDPSKGIVFDGRVSENFKLSTGTWVSVGNLRTSIVACADNVIQDLVIAGHDRDEIGILVFPNIPGCRCLCPELSLEAPVVELIKNKNVRAALLDGLKVHNSASVGSSTKVACARFMSEPPDIDANEITDKGYINQRAVLSQRNKLVTLLYSFDDQNIFIE